ncbi:MAG: hypothetical protein QOC79_2246 [Actinomycetota bacterium]|nr:hypothetical protein [Actinomycetota bacterium]
MGSVRVSGTPDEYPDAGLAEWLEHPKPFVWHKTAQAMITKVRRGRAALTHQTKSATHH